MSEFRLCWYQPNIAGGVRVGRQFSRAIHEQMYPHETRPLFHYQRHNNSTFYQFDLVDGWERIIHVSKGRQLKLSTTGRLVLDTDHLSAGWHHREVLFETPYQASLAFASLVADPTTILTTLLL